MKRFYLLSYCTPARKGEHRVRIVAQGNAGKKEKWGEGDFDQDEFDKKQTEKEENNSEKSGSLEYTFVADGFGPPPKCDPERKPRFKLEATFENEDADAREAAEADAKAEAQASTPER